MKLKSALLIIFFAHASVFGQSREIAVTFDDLPATHGNFEAYKHITDNLLAKLREAKIPAIGFVNESKIVVYGEMDERAELLKKWLDDGHDLGNHTFSHIYIDENSFEDYTADLIRGENVTRMLLRRKNKELKYYRHTQLRTGPTEEYRLKLAGFLKKRGYTVAPVTIDNNDFIYSVAYSYAKARGDAALQARIVRSYIEYMETVFAHFENLSREFLGREIRQTLLLHANEINADHFDRLAAMIKKRGYKFIRLEEALKDPAYSLPETQAMTGLSWLHRWMLAKGLKQKIEPAEPAFINELYRKAMEEMRRNRND